MQLGLADAIADVVSSGRTLRQHGLKAFGDPIAESQATLIEREPRPDREETAEIKAAKVVFTERLRGVVYARQYLMLDYDCPERGARRGQADHPGHAGAHRLAAVRGGLVGGAVDGAQQRGQQGDGRPRRRSACARS